MQHVSKNNSNKKCMYNIYRVIVYIYNMLQEYICNLYFLLNLQHPRHYTKLNKHHIFYH